MRGIEFVSLTDETFRRHTADDWGLVMSEKIIGTPAVKEKIIELADRDGVLDHTEALTGVPAYETRELSFTFEYLDSIEGWSDLFTEIRNFLHGRRLKIHEPDDPNYYYLGRASVGDPSGGLVKTFSVTVRADTWKYPITGETVITEAVRASETIILPNNWRPVCPTITTTGAVTFEFGGANYSITGAGTFRFPKFRLGYGANPITILSGSGEITFKYQEGAI
jgi:hypothetical protein